VRAVLVLGRVALDGFLAMLRETGRDVPRGLAFGHGRTRDLGGGVRLFCSFHVSQQNTFTGRLTPRSFDAVVGRARAHLEAQAR
jgi:uracil-DNA glycosylase